MLHKTKIKISIAILSIICLVGVIVGVVSCEQYNNSNKTNTTSTTESVQNDIQLVYLSDCVSAGNKARISIKGEPYTDYSISVYYNSGESTASGLRTKTSDEEGKVSWSWKVGTRTSPGVYPIYISSTNSKFKTSFEVY